MDEISIIEYKGARVLTTQQLAEAYGTDNKIIYNNFNRNKDRYIEGKHYICLKGEDKRTFLNRNQIDDSSKYAKAIYLWTEKGTFLHAKSLNTDTAWDVYDRLVESYFRVRQITDNRTLSENKELIQALAQIQELTQRIDDMQAMMQDMAEKQNLLEQENTGNKRFNPYGADNIAELEGRKKELYRLTSKVADIYGLTQTKALHNLYLAMEESLNVPLDAYRLVYISETGNVDASTAEVIAANDRLYQAAIRINMIVIERNQIYE